jgi:hypothetical protein
MNLRALLIATVIGAVAQLIMILVGHVVPYVREHLFAIVGGLISLLAGVQYVHRARGGWAASLLGGAVAGGVCALIGIAVSYALGDVPADILLYGTLASTVTGALGGSVRRFAIANPPL